MLLLRAGLMKKEEVAGPEEEVGPEQPFDAVEDARIHAQVVEPAAALVPFADGAGVLAWAQQAQQLGKALVVLAHLVGGEEWRQLGEVAIAVVGSDLLAGQGGAHAVAPGLAELPVWSGSTAGWARYYGHRWRAQGWAGPIGGRAADHGPADQSAQRHCGDTVQYLLRRRRRKRSMRSDSVPPKPQPPPPPSPCTDTPAGPLRMVRLPAVPEMT